MQEIPGSGPDPKECIFCKIVRGEIPAYRVYEDDKTLAFLDIFPIHAGHVLVVPKRHCVDMLDATEEDLKAVMASAKRIAPAIMKATKADGFNIGMNNKPAAGQVVMHVHLHVIPRFKEDGLRTWPQRPYNNDAEKQHVMERIRNSL